MSKEGIEITESEKHHQLYQCCEKAKVFQSGLNGFLWGDLKTFGL